MTLVQHKGTGMFKFIICAILLMIIDMYYLHITNHNPTLWIADNNLLFAMTAFFTAPLFIVTKELLKNYYDEKAQKKMADRFGYAALIALFGGLLFFATFWIGTPPVWASDFLIQMIVFCGIGCISITPKKGDYTLGVSMVFPLMATVVYLCYRF